MFKTRNDRFYIDGDRVRFEGLPHINRYIGLVDTINLGFDFGLYKNQHIKYIQPVISIDNLGNYWVSFSIKEPIQKLDKPKTEPIGIDLGIRKTMTLSTGETFTRPNDKINRIDRRLSRIRRQCSRDNKRRRREANRTKTKYEDIPVSKRSQKRLTKLRKLNKKITNIKNNFYHETIKNIVLRNPEAIVLETTRTREMQRTAKYKQLQQGLHKANFFTMAKIFEDKCTKYGVPLIKADHTYPSTQVCSNCGHRQKLHGKKIYHCPQCGLEMDRDLNAALNLRNLAY